MERYLEGRVAVVTGGIRGIGKAIARKMQARGAAISAWDYDLDGFEAGRDGYAPEHVEPVDVSAGDAVAQAFARTVERFGKVDILVNNAGINGPVMPIWEYSPDMWRRVMSINLDGVFNCTKVVVPHMRERRQGRIINVASIAGKEGVPMIAAYSASKGGVIAFTKSVAKELATDGVTVNCIAPSMVETDLLKQMTQTHIDNMKAKIPMGRFLLADEIAAMAAWIAGPECSFTTGFAFDLTGGRATY